MSNTNPKCYPCTGPAFVRLEASPALWACAACARAAFTGEVDLRAEGLKHLPGSVRRKLQALAEAIANAPA